MTTSRPSFRAPLAALLALILALAAACSPAASPSPTPVGSAAQTSAPTPTAFPGIQHPTGAGDVILRMETGGGLVPIDFFATAAPGFTLYGDGTVVFRDPTANPPNPIGNVSRLAPFLTLRLDEAGIQALLTDAIGPGGLGVATGPYVGLGADIPTTTFTIAADGRTKTVSVVGLEPAMHPKDTLIVTALSGLAARLDGFARAVVGEHPYVPAAFRGSISPIDQPFGPVVAWPWTTILPGDFVKGEDAFFLTHTLTPADVAVLAIPDVSGGLQGLTLQSAGKLYSFALRPLLPEETS